MSKYQPGHIVELTVTKKLLEAQLVIFELEGISARLHVSNISNSPDLSRKLFNIIRLGEKITSVIIGFNQEKQYIELSLKPFRNQLEGSLSFTKCRNIIDSRKEMRTNLPKDILEENRNQLDRIQGDLAKVDLTFLYELIQNAIDHPNPNFNNLLSIKFEVYNDYLLLKHNGSIFTENNFRSLTGILLGEEDTGEARIGYKGIGFKSIFRYTQEVYIRSGNFSFSFSKERGGARMPWEVIPIFENEIDKVEEIKNFEFFNTPVAFAFKFTNPELKEQAIQYLEQLVALPETLLFLDKLARLEVVVGDRMNKITREVIKHDTYNKINLQLNSESPLEWIVCQEKNIITDEQILKELKDENNPSIPLKFRNFNTPQVQIAFPLSPRKDLINMYAYLPLSETKCGLPFILNGDFIPNLDRTDIIRNLKYNHSLANLAAKTLSKLFKIVSKEYGIDQALSLVTISGDARIEFFKHLNEAFVAIKDELTIVINSNQEVALKKFVIDKSGLFNIFKPTQIQLHDSYKDNFVFGKLNVNTEQYLIDKIGLRIFSVQNGIELLANPEIIAQYFSNFTDVLKFLFRISRLINRAEWYSKIDALKIIKQGETLYAIKDLYKNVPVGFEDLFKTTLGLNSLGKEVVELIKGRPRIVDMLVKFGLKEFNLSEALRMLIALSDKFKNDSNTIGQVWHFLYENRNAINADGSRLVNERFKSFPIITIDNKVEILENCYAGDLEESDAGYSYLFENFGKEQLTKVDLSLVSNLCKVDSKEIVDFLKTIHENIKLTDKTLFRRALKSICAIPKEELKERKDTLRKALISVFYFNLKFPKENLIELGMLKFPVITRSNEIEQISFTYFDKSYVSFINDNELYAEELFQNINGVSYIASSYLNLCPETDKDNFVRFLRNYLVSPGIKYFNSNLIKKGDRVNIAEIDMAYKTYNNGYADFKTANEFYIIKDIAKLAGSYNNLILFWKQVVNIKPLNLITSDITCNSYSRPNPFIWFIKTVDNMFPMQGSIVKSASQIHANKLYPYILSPNDKLSNCFNENTEPILDKLSLKTTLEKSVIINCLQNLNLFSFEQQKAILLEHFAKTNFNVEEIETIKSNGNLIAQDLTIQKINNLIYLDKSLEATSILLDQTTYSANKIVFTFEYDNSFKNAISRLKVPIQGIEHVQLKSFDVTDKFDSDSLKKIIIDFATKQKLGNTELIKLNQSEFKLCSKISLGLKDLIDFEAHAESFYQKENNIFYFTELRELTELLCEIYKWPISENKKLRKFIETGLNNLKGEAKETSDKNNDKFIEEVNDFIKELEIEGTEWNQHIIELKKLISSDTNLGEQKQMAYNLLAKLKLSKSRKIPFVTVNENDRQYNYLEGNGEKYIVHSARGSFAYISPIEILKMRDEGYKMALDFGDKKPIKIYHKAEEILRMNTNHLLLYQNDKTMEELFAFCESNQSANKRLLIIDKDHASNKSKELLKLMIPDEEY